MQPQPLVSILINNYNYDQFLPDSINSALSQTYSNIEIVVVDDGSTDNSSEIIASYGDAIIPVLKANGGQASAFNAGFAASRGDIICFLDADDIFLPEKVAEVVRILKDYQESLWCFHPLKKVDSADILSINILSIKSDHQNLVQECDVRSDICQGGGRMRQKLPFSIPATSGLCFTRPLLQQVFPMPEAEGIGLGDTYLQFTSVALGKGFAALSNLAYQRVHDRNLYTHNANRKPVTANISCLTAFWIRTNFPFLTQFAHKLFAAGLNNYWKSDHSNKTTQETLNKYLASVTFLEKLKIYLRSLYYYFTSIDIV
jgi:glycosyltransferase involved in cell wall biosynthesis